MKYFRDKDDLISIKQAFQFVIDDLADEKQELKDKEKYFELDIENRQECNQPYYEQEKELKSIKSKLEIIFDIERIIDDRITQYDIVLEEEED